MGVEIADIFRRFGGEYLDRYDAHILPSHRRAIADIMACRTPALGGHLWYCEDCGRELFVYHGCRNRSCPACHTAQTKAWLEARQAEIIPCDHFHITVTIPELLRPVFRSHQKDLYSLFMRLAAEAVMILCRDQKHLGAMPAMLAVLHTWTGRLDYHPHVHFLVTAGGLSPDGLKWMPSKPGFLVPVKALSLLLRRLMRDALRQLHQELYKKIPDPVWDQKWVVNCLPWAGGREGVLNYLARYVFRIAITNRRIISIDDGFVAFKYKDRKKRRLRTCRLEAMEFMRRYLQHVLPKGFHKVRYYGLWHHSNRPKAAPLVRQLLRLESENPANIDSTTKDHQSTPAIIQPALKTPYTPGACPYCRSQNLVHLGQIPRPRFRGS